jgi:hypothetical protein
VPAHPSTTEGCFNSFAGIVFSHVGIDPNNCAVCHATGIATPKISNHIPAAQECSGCHQDQFFPDRPELLQAADHLPTWQDCSVCHINSSFTPSTFAHVAITGDCSFCYATATFAGGTFDHQGINDGCESCHNGVIAIGSEPQGRDDPFVTNAQCIDCHSTQCWAPINYTHPAASDYPGDHRANLGCRSWDGDNDEAINYRWNQYAPYCAACHANDFERKGDHIGGQNGTVEQNKDCSNGGRGCYRVSDRKFD